MKEINDMMKLKLYDIDSIEDSRLSVATVMARYQDKWIFVRVKNQTSWQLPGGHREIGESIEAAAARELIEETGAEQFSLLPVCISEVQYRGEESFGVLYYAKIDKIGELPESEIEEVAFFNTLPEEQAFPDVHPTLFHRGEEFERELIAGK